MEMMMRFKNLAEQMANAYEEVEEMIVENGKKQNKIDGEINDIKHVMEFVDLNASAGFDIYKQFQTACRKRRMLKDEYEVLKRAKVAMKNNVSLEKHAMAMSRTLEKLDDENSNRVYRVRTRTDFINKYGHKCKLTK